MKGCGFKENRCPFAVWLRLTRKRTPFYCKKGCGFWANRNPESEGLCYSKKLQPFFYEGLRFLDKRNP